MTNTAELIQFRHLGFENFDFVVLSVILGRLTIAALLGGIIAYRPWRYFMHWYFERTESGAQVLIAVTGALMTSVIGNNVALAFGLVGLGGFIRFRSGIKDPREAGVMFLMIGIGMSSGIGRMPLALVSTGSAFILLAILDVVDRNRGKVGRRRIRIMGVQQPREFEPRLRQLLAKHATVRGSKISVRRDEVTVDIYGERYTSAGDILTLLSDAGIEFQGDVSCEEI
ncbi:DUF4956 domain-containing protein [Haliangium ochraceum]|uniref:DUF4956 domain-containing protein n=1 Tax=Haliangium ochraceum (strain DSM 14365 / JCM 11303 / SMP-2) TaxID=502025 RepID=D0LG68_HALO1|nr:DUF4956 domain-containing protein [Haliangium ochraceum]ACY18093.1 hypothetical protein Hoch_5613 [Haliangium ochraceum DSM 14365]